MVPFQRAQHRLQECLSYNIQVIKSVEKRKFVMWSMQSETEEEEAITTSNKCDLVSGLESRRN